MSCERILLIEDDRFMRSACETSLAHRGFNVVTATNGQDGLRLAKNEAFDLILLDVLMPRKPGLDVLGELKAGEPTRHVPVLILSNSSRPEDRARALELGAAGFHVKSNLSLKALGDEITQQLRRAILNLAADVPAGTAALAEPYDAHGRAVYSLALRILRVPADAEDVTQEVFLQAWRSAARFDAARGTLAAWLLIMTRTRALDRLRRARHRPVNAVDPSAFERIPAASPGVDVMAATNEEMGRARRALAGLPAEQREAVELAYFEGLTHSEIAARTAQPLGTVKTRIRTGMQQLRTALKGRTT